jgi:hypothetical protein
MQSLFTKNSSCVSSDNKLRAWILLALTISLAGCYGSNTSKSINLTVPEFVEIEANDPNELSVGTEITLKNSGGLGLTIVNITGSCACSEVNPIPPIQIAPGEATRLTMKVEIPIRMRGRRVLLTYSLANGDSYVTVVDVKRSSYFTLVPPFHDFGSIPQTGKHSAVVEIEAPPEQLRMVEVSAGDVPFVVETVDGLTG